MTVAPRSALPRFRRNALAREKLISSDTLLRSEMALKIGATLLTVNHVTTHVGVTAHSHQCYF